MSPRLSRHCRRRQACLELRGDLQLNQHFKPTEAWSCLAWNGCHAPECPRMVDVANSKCSHAWFSEWLDITKLIFPGSSSHQCLSCYLHLEETQLYPSAMFHSSPCPTHLNINGFPWHSCALYYKLCCTPAARKSYQCIASKTKASGTVSGSLRPRHFLATL